MSLPGHNPEASMLQGGEGVNIAPNQAGGGLLKGGEDVAILPSQAGGAIQIYQDIADYVLTSEELAAVEASANFNDVDIENIKGAAVTAGILAKDANLPAGTDLKEIALKAAGIQALKTLKLNQQNEAGAMPSDLTRDEIDAATLAKELAVEQRITDPNTLKQIQIKAILIQRKKDNFRIEQVKSQAEPAGASPLITEINNLKDQELYTEFYHLFKPKDDDPIFDKYESMITNKSNIIENVVTAEDKIPKDVYTDVKKYKDQRLKMWNNLYQPTGRKVAPIIPILGGISDANEREVITKYSRLAYCLPYNIERVVIIPPIMGDIELFKMTLYRLEKIGALTYKTVQGKHKYRIKNGIVIAFMPLFYDSESVDALYNNMWLFSIFVDIHHNNPNQIFILSESTTDNYNIGTNLTIMFKNNPSDINNNNAILTMLEPSYIIYPYARKMIDNGFIISASKENEMGNMPNLWFSMNDLKLSKLYGNALGFAVKPSAEHKVIYDGDIFVIRSSTRDRRIIQLRYEEESTSACEGLLVSPHITTIIENNPFYLTKVKITTDADATYALMTIQLNPKGEYIPLCKIHPESLALGADDKHKHSDKANAAVPSVEINIKGHIYSIRINDDTVYRNWENREFTKDEADFLNMTELTPGVLGGTFKSDWHTKLANFLKVFTTFKCIDDTALLTDQQCYICRDFLEEINKYLTFLKLDKDFQEADFNRYARTLYAEEDLNDEIELKEATHSDKIAHKMKFGVISSYQHRNLGEGGERRALITGVNRVTGNYKFYTVSTPLTADEIEDDKKLMNIVTNELPKKYRNYTFVY